VRRALALLPLLGACAPAVLHGPRVEPGLHLGMSVGLPTLGDTATLPDAATPGWTPYVMYGFAGRPGGVAGSVALATGGHDGEGMEADVYVQLPSARPALAYGAGVVGSDAYVMPYAQLGRDLGLGYEVYTTQAVVRRWDFTTKRNSLDASSTDVRPTYWAPAVALRRRERALAATLEVTGVLGRFDERTTDPVSGAEHTRTRPLRGVTVRVQADVDLGALLHDALAVTRRPVPRRTPP
jgi:hypothetical protein